MPRRLFSAAAAGALLLGLAACGDTTDGPATAPPPDLGIAAPSDGGGAPAPSDGGGEQTDPSADAPDIPPPDPADYAGMDENTPEGAEQAFRYYIAVSMWTHRTGDDKVLRSLEGQGCTGCAELNSDLPKLQEAGSYWGEYSLKDDQIEVYPGDIFDQEVSYSFVLSEHLEPDVEAGGSKQVSETEYVTTGGMVWSNDMWIVEGLQGEWGPDAFDS